MSDRSTADDADRVLADCLEDYHRRLALAENPQPEDYAERAAGRLDDLRRIVETERKLDAALGDARQTSELPRPFGDYTLLRELGRGAMGVVYEAVHRPLGRTVALKILRTGLDVDAVALERFRREARACAQVRHPRIVEVYDAGECDGHPYYSMALLRGRALAEAAGTAAEPDRNALLRGFAGIADALQALHAAGIVHRDVKPSNLLVAEDGAMILADFGLARTAHSERVTSTGQALGTPLYMSPEQMLGRASEIDGRADVYGLGAAMYEVFVGRPLFRFDDLSSAMRMILREQPDKPRLHRPDLPEALENVILKCLEKRKEDRYQDAAALRDDLLNLAEGREAVGRPVSRAQHGFRRVRPWLPAAAAAVIAAAAGVWAWSQRDATVTVSCWPAARVSIDGSPVGEPGTTVVAMVDPGRHRLQVEQAGFAARTEEFDVAAGERLTLQRVLVARSGDDADALACIGRELDVAMAAIEPLTSERSAAVPPIRLLWPRGAVRLDDLTTWRADVTERFAGKGRIVIRRGDDVLGEVPFEPTGFENERAIPDAVRAALAPGDRIAWSYVPEQGEPVTAEFVVSGKDMAARLAKIAERTREQPKGVAAHVRARMLLDAGLCCAAYREARLLIAANPADRRAWLVLQHALDGMQLRGTEPWLEACRALGQEERK